ncbi:hypothetical protein G2W53_004261 [Senna tora]|uniref:Transposase-associated domain-containing protein n=1 Tax=Senna tora TaxID=362788 RepID=A0A834XEU9_9FABA|nr:hypothetical protein G2W53_004261 [Senna tora]
MDKSWITKPRNTLEYAIGLEKFLDFAFLRASSNGRIKCPCSSCGFRKMESRDVVYEHLMRRQFPSGYTLWLCHGETRIEEYEEAYDVAYDNFVSQNNLPSQDSMQDMIHDAFGIDEVEMIVPEENQRQNLSSLIPNDIESIPLALARHDDEDVIE